ncbi:MAG: presenilin family intramembrane aspartyl protease [Candidatus Woesearchaeota archaeon]
MNAQKKVVLFFLVTQLIGIFILSYYIDFPSSATEQQTVIHDTYVVAPPQVENETFTFLTIIVAIILGTILLFTLIKYQFIRIWKLWFFLSIVIALYFSFTPFTAFISVIYVPFTLAILFAYLKITNKHQTINNATELFIYPGIAAIFVPIINIYSAFALIFFLAMYDIYMVNKSKHMVTLAKAQLKNRLFAGLSFGHAHKISSKTEQQPIKNNTKKTVDGAVLGGGDLFIPLVFAGAAMKYTGSVFTGISIGIFATISLMILYAISTKGRFYPAIPFVGAGSIVGFFLSFLF